MLDRVGDWVRFSKQVKQHIVQYTIPQYQDKDGDKDQVGAWDSATCIENMRRYINRAGKKMRGPKEELRDMLKVAHYAQFAYDKLKQELNESDVYKEVNAVDWGEDGLGTKMKPRTKTQREINIEAGLGAVLGGK